MFELGLSEEQELVRRAAADFGRERLLPAARAHERAGAPGDALRSAYRDAGFATLELAATTDGGELGALEKALALEGLSAGDAGSVLALEGIGSALYALELGGDRGRALAREIARNPAARGWVVVDADGSAFEARAGRIRGRWPWIPASELALLVVVQGSNAYVVTDGVALEPVLPCALHAAGSSELRVDAHPIAIFQADAVATARLVARLRQYAASMLLGVAAGSLRHATSYAKERVAFGRPVAHHQGVAFLIAELATRLDAARVCVWRAAWAIERHLPDAAMLSAQAYALVCETALEVCEQGVQLLGGHGYMQDHPAEKWMREARALSTLWGGADGAIELLAGGVLDASLDPLGAST